MFALCCWNSTCSRALRMHWAQFLASSQKIWRRRNHRQCPVLRVSLSLSGCGRDDPWIGTFHRSLGTMDGGTVVPFNPWQINLWYVYRFNNGYLNECIYHTISELPVPPRIWRIQSILRRVCVGYEGLTLTQSGFSRLRPGSPKLVFP